MALHVAVNDHLHAIYTTPLKALSNQKFTELRLVFGKQNVGLATGDMSINRGANVTVMTTEVYRNIAWRSSGSRREPQNEHVETTEERLLNENLLEDNKVVVLDEFHYMGQPGRGGVWEECVITSPAHTQIVGLSATLPNALQLAEWMEGVTGRKTVLVEAKEGRPVPLRYLFAIREGLYPLFRDPDAGPGAPHGLLGLRGDGGKTGEKKKRRSTRGGFDDENDDDLLNTKVPKGLRINTALLSATQRRMQRVNRAIDRQKARMLGRGGESDWDLGRRGGKMSARDERRERERLLRSEMRKAVPSLPVLLKRLEQKDLLPAIFFIFSRAGCDEAAETVCQFMKGPRDVFKCDVSDVDDNDERPQRKRKTRQRASRRRESMRKEVLQDSNGRSFRRGSNIVSDDVLASVFEQEITKRGADTYQSGSPLSSSNWDFYANAGLLRLSEVEEVAARVATFNENNHEIAFTDEEVEHFLFGVGSHHAGMLAAHKAFVETLYRAQLMKAVFATETLAAGINMPARTTVICALAKRGNSNSMNLLETSNLLQMAGRAGRRGMDTDGTCVIVATRFEGQEDAARILTSEIKPIVSQFTPSYSLATNLIARGEGKLDIARQLVQKSFAMWEKRQLEDSIASAIDEHGNKVSEVVETAAQERFMMLLLENLQAQIERKSALFDLSKLKSLVEILDDREVLKKTSKSYLAASRILNLEFTTMEYLEREKEEMASLAEVDEDDELLGEFMKEDQSEINEQIELQRERVKKTGKELRRHPFTALTSFANKVMESSTPEGNLLSEVLKSARASNEEEDDCIMDGPLEARELSTYAKSAIVMKRKARKLQSAKPDLDSAALLEQVDKADTIRDDTWQDMLALTKVLVAYGCLSTDASIEDDEAGLVAATYRITQAGVNIGMLGFENSLWGLVAMGGAWDVMGASASLDEFKATMDDFDDDGFDFDFYDDDGNDDDAVAVTETQPLEKSSTLPRPQEEAETLLNQLRDLTPSELAGYVSCLVSEGSRGSPSIVESFQRLEPRQQRVIQSSLLVLERLMEVQKQFSVDEGSRRCNLELSNCEVVTAWAAGCSWTEALQISGAAPGDLVRTLGRALDTLRQFGNLPFVPVRATDLGGDTFKTTSHGIHPEVRRLCRDAARAINRYPVKDPLPFDTEETEVDEEFDDVEADRNEDETEEASFADEGGENEESSAESDNTTAATT
jgi:superfamily II RNA helicase